MSTDLGQQLQRANELVGLGRDRQAMDLLLHLLRAHPDAAGPIEICLARAHLVAGRPDEGRQHALQAIALAPEVYGGYLFLGMALHQLGRPQDAVEPLRTATQLDREDADPPQRLAQVLSDLGRADEAYAAAAEALRRDPHTADNHFAMGYVLHDANPTEATRAYRKALELDPEHHGAKHNLAGQAIQRGDWTAGSRGMAQVLADSPQAGTPVFLLDQRVVGTIRWLHWVLLVGFLGYGIAASLGGVAPLLWTVVVLLGAVVVGSVGLKPLRAALPQRGARFLRGFPRREVIAAVWAGLLGLGWLWLLGSSIAGLVGPPDARWAGMGVVGFLAVGLLLSWARLPIARARIRRLRHRAG
ncbi:tetratricopeptide repeat protein [Granulicoccus phenolivorans]|uniref:tetratricopeptide repeat protein n=1 Tax=Granulicoccus phenolivorans TaxID=266854 RepID=UPI00040093DB|nr:tetratricopeptide repeat protein [Granulicoccus phenolivorans]